VNGLRVHDLRHTAASFMIQAGYPPKMLQEIMGHASITTTLDMCGHLSVALPSGTLRRLPMGGGINILGGAEEVHADAHVDSNIDVNPHIDTTPH
jgi:integrase-like protein